MKLKLAAEPNEEDYKRKKMETYKVKNRNGEYFVSWDYKDPIFSHEAIFGKKFSKTGTMNLIQLLSDENICECKAICNENEVDYDHRTS